MKRRDGSLWHPRGNIRPVRITPVDNHSLFTSGKKGSEPLQQGATNTISLQLKQQPLTWHRIKSLSEVNENTVSAQTFIQCLCPIVYGHHQESCSRTFNSEPIL